MLGVIEAFVGAVLVEQVLSVSSKEPNAPFFLASWPNLSQLRVLICCGAIFSFIVQEDCNFIHTNGIKINHHTKQSVKHIVSFNVALLACFFASCKLSSSNFIT